MHFVFINERLFWALTVEVDWEYSQPIKENPIYKQTNTVSKSFVTKEQGWWLQNVISFQVHNLHGNNSCFPRNQTLTLLNWGSHFTTSNIFNSNWKTWAWSSFHYFLSPPLNCLLSAQTGSLVIPSKYIYWKRFSWFIFYTVSHKMIIER